MDALHAKRLMAAGAALAATVVGSGTASALPGSSAAVVDWVALGDSYTAGVIPASGAPIPEPGGRSGCERTTGAYPRVVAETLTDIALTDVSCGNAQIKHVVAERQVPIGQGFPEPDPEGPFNPVPIQLDAINASTDVVTVGIGGNTLGFGEILITCLVASGGESAAPCMDYYASGATTDIDTRLDQLAIEYAEMLKGIHAKAPDAMVFTVGYPSIIPNDVNTCSRDADGNGREDQFGNVKPGDLDWLRSSVLEKLNERIRDVSADDGRAQYVDVYSGSQGHDACAQADQKWVEGLKTADGDWALVHPNAGGQNHTGERVAAALQSELS
ncbi:SGNH/GDSL hydrolase family protein [Streptomyces sp. TRM66268-LWL]|uniref:SGNH/GDSL hydrolase family protein n=1 Tax=Streptomyces polyasparticus TaxID=2767826 RepID=A0ABR7SZA7_9ACTN|nr:SGNH/GDSL hydrolase family protein [Streptomyces polyasparticus]MBC9719603.1 SGNH/GDSL hydrolase family protein [Streptomyces polyasparticus]